MTQSEGLGTLTPDPFGVMLGTGYSRFNSPLGIEGLAKESNGRVDILAVVAPEEGKGHLAMFLAHCMTVYDTICIWEDWNPILGPMLARRGFVRISELDKFKEKITGWRWDRKTPPGNHSDGAV